MSLTTTPEKPKGECEALGFHVFDYGTKGAADQAINSWEKFCDHCGTEYGPLLAQELKTGIKTVLDRPTHSQEELDKQARHVLTKKAGIQRLITALETQAEALKKLANEKDAQAGVDLALKQMEI